MVVKCSVYLNRLVFVMKWKCFVMIDHFLSGTIVNVSAFCFQIFTFKLILWPQMCLTYGIIVVNWIFGFFIIKKYFSLFFIDFQLLLFRNNIVKI